ncbi:MAG: aminoglycoside phosphotransferase family protein [Oscillospiraceae bacterium]|nr:aminoglycoside phosphotransferase family protein [Oscillospiraceae bacterium]
MKDKLSYLCRQFRLRGELLVYRPIPSGHINTAYYVALYDGTEVCQYLVQRINRRVFRDPVALMHNVALITEHLARKAPTAERRRRLHFHHTAAGHNYLFLKQTPSGFVSREDAPEAALDGDAWECWRVCNYVERSVTFEAGTGSETLLRMAGKAFGTFNRQLADFDANLLAETIPHFHDTVYRMNTLFDLVALDPMGRARDCAPEIALLREHRAFAGTLCRQLAAGELPLRVTHNDTKTNNALFDRDTLEPLVVIDLDTCMPGLACYDFGDSIRFAACAAGPADGMRLDLTRFRAYAEGYLSETDAILSEAELSSLPLGAAVMTLELASRYLADYLSGDRYFRIDAPDRNLRRARAQLALFRDMLTHRDDMACILAEVRAAQRRGV